MQQVDQRASDAIHKRIGKADLLVTYFVPNARHIVGVFKSPVANRYHVIVARLNDNEWAIEWDGYDAGVEEAFKLLAQELN